MIQAGLRVLVTGAASGIGWAIALALQEQGARVHLCDSSSELLAQAIRQQPEMSGTVADVSDAQHVDRVFASKWAVIGFTESLAMELGPHGIRVNALLPGIVEGERIRRVIAARAGAQGVPYDEMEGRYLGQISLRRMVAPADVAAMVLFLCSPAGRNISGQSLGVCGNVESLR